MITLPRSPIAFQGRILSDRRFVGPMPWVLAIMIFLTVLTTAAGLGLRQAAAHMREALTGRVTIQIVEADPRARAQQMNAAMTELRRLAGVQQAERVDPARLKSLLEPWLGNSLNTDDLPMPGMIDVDLTPEGRNHLATIGEVIRSVAPSARIDQHSQWLAPIDRLMRLLQWLSLTLLLLMAVATAFTVVLAARATLDTHRDTIDVMHLLGATDGQIAGLFQKPIALDALLGGTIGFFAALLVVFVLSRHIESLGSELIGSVTLTAWGWLVLILLPLAGAALAMATARFTILNTLGRIL